MAGMILPGCLRSAHTEAGGQMNEIRCFLVLMVIVTFLMEEDLIFVYATFLEAIVFPALEIADENFGWAFRLKTQIKKDAFARKQKFGGYRGINRPIRRMNPWDLVC